MAGDGATPTDYTAIAVAIGGLQVRVEEGFKAVNETLKTVTETSKSHGEVIAQHAVVIPLLDQRVTVLEAAKPKRTPWYQTSAVVFAGLASVAGVTGAIVAIVTAATHHA